MHEDEHAIRDVIKRWMDATRRGDVEAVLDLMTADVVFMTPGREPFGKAEFAAQSRAMAGARIDGAAEVLELQILDDWAWLRSRLEIVMTPPQGEPVRRSGYALTVMRKAADGRWRLARDANLVGPAG